MKSKPTNVRWGVFALAFGTSWLLYFHRYTFALIKPILAEEWGLKSGQLGLMDMVFQTCYLVFQFPLAVLADSIGVHLVLAALTVIWSVALGLHAVPNIWALWFARGALGFGQSAVFANINRICRTWIPRSIRTTVQGWVGVFAGRFGGVCAYVLFGSLVLGVLLGGAATEKDEANAQPAAETAESDARAARVERPQAPSDSPDDEEGGSANAPALSRPGLSGWRIAVYVLAGIGVIHGVTFFIVFRNSPRTHPWVNEAEAAMIEEGETAVGNTRTKMTARQVFARMSPRSVVNLLCLNVQSIFSTVADNIYSNWIPLFLFEVHQLKFKEMGIYSSLPLLGGALGGMMGGYLNDSFIHWTGNRRWSRSTIALVGKGLAAVLLFAALLFYDSPYVFCGFLFFVKLFGDWSLTTAWGTISDIGGRATASVFAFNNCVAGIGAIFISGIYGFMAQYYGWQTVFITAGIAYVLCALSWLLVNCTIPLLREDDGKA